MALEWLVERGDPKVICHPCVVIFSDLLWSRLAQHPGADRSRAMFLFAGHGCRCWAEPRYNFLLSRCYFLFSLCVAWLFDQVAPYAKGYVSKQGDLILWLSFVLPFKQI